MQCCHKQQIYFKTKIVCLLFFMIHRWQWVHLSTNLYFLPNAGFKILVYHHSEVSPQTILPIFTRWQELKVTNTSHQPNFMAIGISSLPPPISGINYIQRFGIHLPLECSSQNSSHTCSRSISVRTNCILILHAIICYSIIHCIFYIYAIYFMYLLCKVL